MTEYSKLAPLARARLAEQDPKRYRALRAAHHARIEQLTACLPVTTNLSDRKAICAELAALEQPGSNAAPASQGLSVSELADQAMENAYRARPDLRPKRLQGSGFGGNAA